MSRLSFILIAIIGILGLFALVPAVMGQERPAVRGVDIGDVDVRAEKPRFEIFRLQFARAEEVQPIVADLCHGGPRRGGAQPTLRLIADPRTNSMLVTGRPAALQRVKQILALLDRKVTAEQKPRSREPVLNVMFIKNRRAAPLGSVVKEIVASVRGFDARVVVDVELNALITYASAEANERVRKIVAALDQKPEKGK